MKYALLLGCGVLVCACSTSSVDSDVGGDVSDVSVSDAQGDVAAVDDHGTPTGSDATALGDTSDAASMDVTAADDDAGTDDAVTDAWEAPDVVSPGDTSEDTSSDAGSPGGDVESDVTQGCWPPGAVGCADDADCCGASACVGASCGEGGGGGGVCSNPTRPPCGCGAAWQDCAADGLLCVAAGCDYPGVCLSDAEILDACADPELSDCFSCPVCQGQVCAVPEPECTELGLRTYNEQFLGCDGASASGCQFAFDTFACADGQVCQDGACVAAPAGDCAPTVTSGLDGVAIELKTTDCTYTLAEAAAGVTFQWDVVIDAPVEAVVPSTQDAGNCGQAGPSGLIVFPRIQGGEQSWCICDTGLCMPPSDAPVTLAAGTTSASFEWDGVNWFGPSDFGNPKGEPFPPGTYMVTLSAKGSRDGASFEVLTSFPITLTE